LIFRFKAFRGYRGWSPWSRSQLTTFNEVK